MATNTLHWTNSTRKLSELVPQPDNPRQIDAVQAKRLVESYKEFSQTDMLLIGPDNELYNGHQRVNEWAAAFGLDLEVEVRVASRPLARAEWQKLTVLSHRGAVGQWDMGVLEEWDIDESLVEWGFEAHELEWDIPKEDDWKSAFDKLPDGERPPFQQMTFTLHDEQAEIVRQCLGMAKNIEVIDDTLNANSNGNAITKICDFYMDAHGES